MSVPLRDIVARLDELYPPETAQSWDQVGLVTGDLDQEITLVLLALDPTLEVIAEARQAHAELLVTHHPLLLRGVHSVATTTAKGASVTELIVSDIALYAAHTNADVAKEGVAVALAKAAGLGQVEPLATPEGQPMGRVGDLARPVSLAELAKSLHASLPKAAGGIRVAGPQDAEVRRIAVLGGAGDSEFDAVRAAGADVYVTADLRHHPAVESREESRGGPPYLIDAGHWSTEAVWLPLLRSVLADSLSGDDGERPRVEIQISTVRTDPWTFTVGAQPPGGMP